MSTTATTKRRQHGIANGYRSGLEESVASDLKERGVEAAYEQTRIRYTWPERAATYTPDFVLPNGIIIETKGRFTSDDRKKHLTIQAQLPDLDIRFVFTNSRARIAKNSRTTYAAWCEKYGFKYADKRVPEEWLHGAK